MKHIIFTVIFVMISGLTVQGAVNPTSSRDVVQTEAKTSSTKNKKTSKKAKALKIAKVAKSTKSMSKSKTSKTSKKTALTSKKKVKKKDSKWNASCDGLLDNSVSSTIALEKRLTKKKKKLTREEFDEQVHNELLVVQLNAWVCAISSDENKKGASVEQEFLKDYSDRVRNRKL